MDRTGVRIPYTPPNIMITQVQGKIKCSYTTPLHIRYAIKAAELDEGTKNIQYFTKTDVYKPCDNVYIIKHTERIYRYLYD